MDACFSFIRVSTEPAFIPMLVREENVAAAPCAICHVQGCAGVVVRVVPGSNVIIFILMLSVL